MPHRLTQYVTWASDTRKICIPGTQHQLGTSTFTITLLIQRAGVPRAQRIRELAPEIAWVHLPTYDVHIRLSQAMHTPVTIVLTKEDDV